jgi:hypothetical protein
MDVTATRRRIKITTTGDEEEEEMIIEVPVMRCAVLACRKVITVGSEYYPLAAGTVNTCAACATANDRGWDKVRGMKKVL